MNRLAYVTLLSLAVLLGVRARAITAGEIDFNNTHENVAATLITVGPGHPAGVPEGTLVGQCTGTLIHPNMWRKGLQRTDSEMAGHSPNRPRERERRSRG
jgi:hypothetical protein